MYKKLCAVFIVYFSLLSSVHADEVQKYIQQREMASCIVNDTCKISGSKNGIKECLHIPDNEEFEDSIIVIGDPCSADEETRASTAKVISKILHSIKKLPFDVDFGINLSTDINVAVIYVPIEINIHLGKKGSETQKAQQTSKSIPVIMVRFKKDIFFDFNSSELKSSGSIIIYNLVHDVLASSDTYKIITVIGHADNVGTKNENFTLSKERSDITVSEIQKQLDKTGDSFLIESIGAGETQPTVYFAQETKSQANRRVEIFFSTSSNAMYKAKKYIQCLHRNKPENARCFGEYLTLPVE